MQYSPLEKMIVTQQVYKFLAPYGTQKLITVFKRTHHWSLVSAI